MTADDLGVAVIIASTRRGRFGPTVAAWFTARAARRGDLTIDVVDLAESRLPDVLTEPGEPVPAKVAALAPRLDAADGFVIVTPEYNVSFPAPLKTAIDWFDEPWHAKPVAFVSYRRESGGMHAVSQLRQIFTELHAVPLRTGVSLPCYWEQFAADGSWPRASADCNVAAATLDHLTWWARVLRDARPTRPDRTRHEEMIMRDPTTRSGTVTVDGLDIYHEIHGEGPPLILLHGAMATIDTLADLLPGLAEHHTVIAVELQGHGRTPDIDRPLTYPRLAADVAGLMRALDIAAADVVGYSLGGAVGLQLAIDRPELVRRLVWFGGTAFHAAGLHPELLENLDAVTGESLVGTPWHDAYAAVAPDPDGWSRLVAKITESDRSFTGWDPDQIRGITAPTLLIAGDADLARPEHVIEMFRLFGGGVFGDLQPMPASQLAILPGTSHIGMLARVPLLQAMITDFLGPAHRAEDGAA